MRIDAELYPWISAAAIAWGLLDCFFGYRIFKVTLAVLGGFMGLFLGQIAATLLGLGTAGQFAGMLAGGLLGAGVAFMLYLAAIFVAGFGLGATLAILLLSGHHQVVAMLSGCVLGVIGGFLAVKLQRGLIVLSTALLGAVRALLGLAYFTDRIDWLYYLQQLQQIPALIAGNPWLFPAIVALAVIGVIAQFELGGIVGRKGAGKADE